MKILLLGGNGFIGRHLASALLPQHDVTIFDLNTDKLSTDFKDNCIQGDIRNYDVTELIKCNDLVVDLIAYANPKLYVDKPLEAFHICFTENLKVVELCAKYNKKIIQFSTCEVYGDHGDVNISWSEDTTSFCVGPIQQHRWIYANAKQTLERLVDIHSKFNDLDYTIIRPFNFIGHDIDFLPSTCEGCPRVFSHFIDSILGSGDIRLVNGGKQRRSYTYIDDAIDCITRIISKPTVSSRQVFNIGSPDNETTILGLAEMMIDIAMQEQWIKWPPNIVTVTGEEFYGEGYADITRRIPNIDKAKNLLEWRPVTNLRETLYNCMSPWF